MAGHLIRRLHQKSTQVFAARMQAEGIDLTPVQFAALDAIHANPGVDQAQVATLIAYDRATIGGVIDRLEKKSLIRREVSARDRRAREVRLSQAGQEVFDRVLPVVREVQDEILSGLDAGDRALFLRLAADAVRSEPPDA
ncbi:MarR family winged helix-turn-helix transcriptional regulator [Shimia biformata]|uniref:MarR family winged helix-turn-helix transcriptional regulator n=1 Tax=Shimia biformata TaxID=1294299 RepID=UPI001EF35DA2|nr:MarR family transcriptional regulator [Shimia biformata]